MNPPQPGSATSESTSYTSLLARLVQSRLVTREIVQECLAQLSPAESAPDQAVATELMRRGLLTRWQWEQLRQGNVTLYLDHERYLLLAQIGQGGMGAVFRARHKGLQRDVALKVLDPRKGVSAQHVDRFRREVAISSRLQHEHIVQALDVGAQGGVAFLVLEFVEGADLAEVVRHNGPLDPGIAAAIGLQAASGLAYAHAQGIVHRDIKPQNILLSTTGVTKILDLGLARVVDGAEADAHTSLTQEGSIMGTVDYMSPEQALDTHSVDARSDLYSLGATLYYLLAGRPPFLGGTMMDKLMRLSREEPAPLGQLRPETPRELAEVVARLMAKRPEDRFQTAEDLVRALRPLAADKISGAAVITRAVQQATDTRREHDTLPAGPAPTFIQAEPTSLLTGRHGRQQSSRGRRPLVTAGVCGAVFLILLGLYLGSGRNRTPDAQPAKAATAAPRKPQPPAEYRVDRTAHYAGIWSLAFSPAGNEIATGGGEGLILVRDPNGGRVFNQYQAYREPVIELAWSKDGRLLASCSRFGEICVWDGRAQPLARVQTRQSNAYDRLKMAFSPDGQELAYPDMQRQGTVRWDFRENRIIAVHEWSGSDLLMDTCYSQDGQWLGAGGASSAMRVWNRSSGKRLLDLASEPLRRWSSVPSFLSDGTLALARGVGIEVWNCETQQRVREIPVSFADPGAPRLAISGSGKCIVANAAGVLSVDFAAGQVRELSALPLLMGGSREVWTFSPDLSHCARADQFTTLWMQDVVSGRGEEVFRDTGVGVENPQPVGTSCVLVKGRGIHDLATGESLGATFLTPRVEDEKKIMRHLDQGVILSRRLSDPTAAQVPAAVQLEGYAGESLFWSADGTKLFGCVQDGILKVTVWDAQSGSRRWHLEAPWSHDFYCGPQSFNANADIAVLPSSEGVIQIVHQATNPPARTIQTSIINGTLQCAITPDGNHVIAWWQDEMTFLFYNVQDGRQLATVKTGVVANLVRPTISPSSRYLLTARQIWNLQSQPVPTLVWEAPPDHAPIWPHRGGGWFQDEVHVAINQDSQVQIWDWKRNLKRATLFVLPENEWAFVNHETKQSRLSLFADRHIRCLLRDSHKQERWLAFRDYGKETGWKNDPERAGLDLLRPAPNRNAKVPSGKNKPATP